VGYTCHLNKLQLRALEIPGRKITHETTQHFCINLERSRQIGIMETSHERTSGSAEELASLLPLQFYCNVRC
jgi:hypothetical protein